MLAVGYNRETRKGVHWWTGNVMEDNGQQCKVPLWWEPSDGLWCSKGGLGSARLLFLLSAEGEKNKDMYG